MTQRLATRGERINRKASIGAEIVRLKAQIPGVEKQARKTPAKTMKAEWEKVRAAQASLPVLRARLVRAETEHALIDTETPDEMPRTSEATQERDGVSQIAILKEEARAEAIEECVAIAEAEERTCLERAEFGENDEDIRAEQCGAHSARCVANRLRALLLRTTQAKETNLSLPASSETQKEGYVCMAHRVPGGGVVTSCACRPRPVRVTRSNR